MEATQSEKMLKSKNKSRPVVQYWRNRLQENPILYEKTGFCMGAPLGSEDRAWVPRGKVLEMADFGGLPIHGNPVG